MPSWDVIALNADLTRHAQTVTGWQRLTLIERHNAADTWTLTGPASSLAVFGAGMGCILDRDGEQITSGRVRNIRDWFEAQGDRMVHMREVAFQSFLGDLTRVVFPDPAKVVGETATTFTNAYDVRTGTVEDVILGYVGAHAGPTAQSGRQVTGLFVPPSQGRGGTVTYRARFNNLGNLVAHLAGVRNMRATVQHEEPTHGVPRLAFGLTTVPDVSANVRFGPAGSVATGLVSSQSFELGMPTVTRVLVLGGGQLAARTVMQLINADAENMWKVRIEQTVDQRQTTDAAEMRLAAEEALEEGRGTVKVEFTVIDGPDVVYRRDYAIGFRVGVDLEGLPDAVSDNVVREVITTVAAESGQPTETIQVVVGTPDATSSTKTARQVARALRRVNNLERSA